MSPPLLLRASLLAGLFRLAVAGDPPPGSPGAPSGREPGGESARLIIAQPGYPGSTKDAGSFLHTLCGHLEEKTGLRGLSGEYHNEEKPALEAIARRPPAFGLVSLGFYLEHRRALGLRAHLRSKPGDRYVVVARAGDVKDAAALEGQPVAGGPLHEKSFLERIVFPRARVESWDAKPVLRATRALRDMTSRKTYRAVVLTGRDLAALSELYPPKTLEKVLESEYYPPALVVSFDPAKSAGGEKPEKGPEKKAEEKPGRKSEENSEEKSAPAKGAGEENVTGERPAGPPAGTKLDAAQMEKVLQAFSGISGDARGREILETMGAKGFEELPQGWLEEMERRYDAAERG